jgi:hypothetical protein
MLTILRIRAESLITGSWNPADEVACGSQRRGTYMRSRTHLALGKDTPMRRPVTPSAGRIVAISQVGGLHHRYHRIAAKTTVGVPPTDFSTTHCLSLANIASAQISLTLAQRLAILQAMRDAFRAVAVLRSAVSTRRDLLLENLALRHQLGVLARSGSTFFVRLTVYSGCACDDGGLVAERAGAGRP